MVEVLIVLILAVACMAVFGMILSYKEVAWFAKEMFSRILKEYDKRHTAEYRWRKENKKRT